MRCTRTVQALHAQAGGTEAQPEAPPAPSQAEPLPASLGKEPSLRGARWRSWFLCLRTKPAEAALLAGRPRFLITRLWRPTVAELPGRKWGADGRRLCQGS